MAEGAEQDLSLSVVNTSVLDGIVEDVYDSRQSVQ